MSRIVIGDCHDQRGIQNQAGLNGMFNPIQIWSGSKFPGGIYLFHPPVAVTLGWTLGWNKCRVPPKAGRVFTRRVAGGKRRAGSGLATPFALLSWEYPNSWMFFVHGKYLFEIDDDWG